MFENDDSEEREELHGDDSLFIRACCMLSSIYAITSVHGRFYYNYHFTKENTERGRG